MGMPGVPRQNLNELATANVLVRRTVIIAQAIADAGGVFIIENPPDRGDGPLYQAKFASHAPLWLVPEVIELADAFNATCRPKRPVLVIAPVAARVAACANEPAGLWRYAGRELAPSEHPGPHDGRQEVSRRPFLRLCREGDCVGALPNAGSAGADAGAVAPS
mgnify:CR=1 FL=1